MGKVFFALVAGLFLAGSALGDGAVLPGEDGTKSAISPAPFPDRMSAYVWRNWGLVPVEKLAEVVGATPAELNAVAADMGLRADPVVLPEWRTKGYITVLRRNWHLLPYDQLLTLLGKTRDELYFSLMEDDFLWVKLGSLKPKCEALRWRAEMRESGKGERERIAAILKEEGLDPNAPEEPRFTFVKEIAAVSPGSRSLIPDPSDSPFDFRVIFSYFADYADPLADPEVGSFPEGLLQRLSAQGVNAVWMHTVLRTLADAGEGSEVPRIRRGQREAHREPAQARGAGAKVRHPGLPLHERSVLRGLHLLARVEPHGHAAPPLLHGERVDEGRRFVRGRAGRVLPEPLRGGCREVEGGLEAGDPGLASLRLGRKLREVRRQPRPVDGGERMGRHACQPLQRRGVLGGEYDAEGTGARARGLPCAGRARLEGERFHGARCVRRCRARRRTTSAC